jgi:hypothetical protein
VRSGIEALGAGPSGRAWELVVLSVARLGALGRRCLHPTLVPAVAGPTEGEEGDGTERRYQGG